MPRRRAGQLVPLEEDILRVAIGRAGKQRSEFHGFELAETLGEAGLGGRLLGHGTLYKALARLEEQGLLESSWEDVEPAAVGRPRRRLYRVTGAAASALAVSEALAARASRRPATA